MMQGSNDCKLATILVIMIMLLGTTRGFCAADYKDEARPMVIICKASACLLDDFYGGAGLGFDNYRLKQRAGLIAPDGDLLNLNPGLSARGWNGSLFFGYGQTYSWFYIAGEIAAGTSNTDTSYTLSRNDVHYTTKVNARTSYNVAILAGTKLTSNHLAYFRVGYIRTLFRTEELGINFDSGFNHSETHWENGLQFGLGMETALYDHWSMRGEYNYLRYGSIKTDRGTQFSVANNQFILSVIYHFTHG